MIIYVHVGVLFGRVDYHIEISMMNDVALHMFCVTVIIVFLAQLRGDSEM